MAGRTPTRADDEAALTILAHVARHGPSGAAKMLGVSKVYCSVLRQRVLAADLAASPGEDADALAAAYGPMRGAV